MVNKAKQSPAKVKYDQKNPTVSFRLSKELKDRLQSYTTARDISFTDFLKEVLAGKEHGRSYEDGYEDGHRDGFLEGWDWGQQYEGQQNEEQTGADFYVGETRHSTAPIFCPEYFGIDKRKYILMLAY